jgi:hypothetical protein
LEKYPIVKLKHQGVLMNIFIRFTAIISIITISACATAPDAQLTTDEVKSIGLVSAVGDTFNISSIGTTAFQNNATTADVSEWDIDGLIIREIQRRLSNQFELHVLEYDKQEIISDYESDMSKFWNAKFDVVSTVQDNVDGPWNNEDSKNSPQLDAILMVTPAMQNSYGLRGSPTLVGPGLYSNSFLGNRNTMLYLGAQLFLLDAKSLEEKRRRIMLPGVVVTPQGERKCFDCFSRTIDNELFSSSFDTLEDEKKAAIRKEFMALIEDSVEYTLMMSGLLPQPVDE